MLIKILGILKNIDKNMTLEEINIKRLKIAKSRVDELRGFYKHLQTFLTANIILIIIKIDLFNWFIDSANIDEEFMEWIEWNFLSIPIIWSIVLLCYALFIFKIKYKDWSNLKPQILKNWEQEKIKEILQEEL